MPVEGLDTTKFYRPTNIFNLFSLLLCIFIQRDLKHHLFEPLYTQVCGRVGHFPMNYDTDTLVFHAPFNHMVRLSSKVIRSLS